METRFKFECGDFAVEFCSFKIFVESKLVKLIGKLVELSNSRRSRRAKSAGWNAGKEEGVQELASFPDLIGTKSQVKAFCDSCVAAPEGFWLSTIDVKEREGRRLQNDW